MKILYIEHYAGSISMGMEFRPYYFACEWMKVGHQVRIISADYSHLRVNNPAPQRNFSLDTVDDVQYQWIHTNTYTGNGLRRVWTMFQFCGKLWLNAKAVIKQFQPDVVISSSTYPLDTWPAQRIAKLADARYIHEAHDIWPLTLTELAGMKKWNPFVILLQMAENSAYRHADHVVSLFPNAFEHMRNHGLTAAKFAFIPNGIVTEDWDGNGTTIPEEPREAFDKSHSQKRFVVCYLGGHALSNALDDYIDAAKLMQDESVDFFLVGKGVEKKTLMKRAEGLRNVRFFAPIPKNQVPAALGRADALYVGLKPCSLYRFGVSLNKIYDYMMAGKPIIYGVEAANNEVSEARCGISVPAGSAQGIADAVHRLMKMTETERAALGQNGKRWVVENRAYNQLAKSFEKVMTR